MVGATRWVAQVGGRGTASPLQVKLDPNQHDRRTFRLRGYDYAQPGSYFVTACTQGRQLLFGVVLGGQMRVNEFGGIVQEEWFRTQQIHPEALLDVFVVMPNHIHGIIIINQSRTGVNHGVTHPRATQTVAPARPAGPGSGSLGAILGQIKSITTKRINLMRRTPQEPVWQRNFYEHIIRTQQALDKIREYILTNPERWPFDPENPSAADFMSDELEDILASDGDL